MRRLKLILIGAGGALLGGLLLLLSGVLNFAASSGHWDATDWLLGMAAQQSVTLRSLTIAAPPLDDPQMVRRGAGHYEMVCATCHGSPGRLPDAFATALTPQPPPLLERMQQWHPPARLFWTIKHGIKRTAMPAWPSQMRDDEVWDMVAFIEAMPEMEAEAYRALAGDRRDGFGCANCHGEDGRGGGAFPRLDIQSADYLADALTAFRDGTRQSGTMISAARGLSDAQIAALAAQYAGTPEPQPIGGGRGAQIALRGIPERDVPACDSCHGAGGRPDYPRLAGQSAAYIETQLRLFSEYGAGRGGRHAGIMAEVVRWLDEADMAAVAQWYAGTATE